MVVPGQSASVEFKAMYPGAFIYHCAVPALDYHISAGMYGMILVEPEGGLEPVDRELYLGQHEVYLKGAPGARAARFDVDAMRAEQPTYVLLNGEKHAVTPNGRGAMEVNGTNGAGVLRLRGSEPDEPFPPHRQRVEQGVVARALANAPQRYVQTMAVPPGSCGVFELEYARAGDHQVGGSRAQSCGLEGHARRIEVEGAPRLDIFNPKPGRAPAGRETGAHPSSAPAVSRAAPCDNSHAARPPAARRFGDARSVQVRVRGLHRIHAPR